MITGECIFLDCIIRLLCFRKQCIPLSAKVVRVLLYNFVFLQIARSDNIGEEHTIEIFSGESFGERSLSLPERSVDLNC